MWEGPEDPRVGTREKDLGTLAETVFREGPIMKDYICGLEGHNKFHFCSG